MDKAKKGYMMVHAIKVNTQMARSLERALTAGQINQNI